MLNKKKNLLKNQIPTILDIISSKKKISNLTLKKLQALYSCEKTILTILANLERINKEQSIDEYNDLLFQIYSTLERLK